MKIRYFLMAAILPMLLLCGCETHDPEEIETDSKELLDLAESVLGVKESVAVVVLKDAGLKADDEMLNTYVKGSRQTAFIKLTLKDGEVSAVELGKDHTTKTDAMVTEKVWSKYTENYALKDYSLWTAQIATIDGDTINYMAGALTQTIELMFEQFGQYIPQEIQDKVYAAMENDTKSFQLALSEVDPESVEMIAEMAYKAEFNITEITQLLSGKEVESASCVMAEQLTGKNTYYRVIYKHDLRQLFKLSEMY